MFYSIPAPELEGRIGAHSIPSADAYMQDGFPQIPFDEWDRLPVIAQVEFEGEPFRRDIPHTTQGGKPVGVMGWRRVRIVGGTDENFGTTIFEPIADVSRIDPSKLLHVPLPEADVLYDSADVTGPDLPTVRKHGSSRPYDDVGGYWRQMGGDPEYRRPKSGQAGWNFQNTADELQEFEEAINSPGFYE